MAEPLCQGQTPGSDDIFEATRLTVRGHVPRPSGVWRELLEAAAEAFSRCKPAVGGRATHSAQPAALGTSSGPTRFLSQFQLALHFDKVKVFLAPLLKKEDWESFFCGGMNATQSSLG